MLWEELSSYFTYTSKEMTTVNEVFYLQFSLLTRRKKKTRGKEYLKREMFKDYTNNRDLKTKPLTRA